MVDIEVEKFTAMEAIDAGLIDAVKRGETLIEGYYEISRDGYFEFKQRNFTFTDTAGGLRAGKFVNNYELMNFSKNFNAVS